MNIQIGVPKRKRTRWGEVYKEVEKIDYPVFYRDIKPTQYAGPNIFGKTVTCWGLTGIDKKTGIQAFVRLDNPEQAKEFYERE